MLKDFNHISTQEELIEKVNQGVPRNEVMAWLREEKGMTPDSARVIYYDTLSLALPDVSMLDTYKASLIQKNLDRLEGIIEQSITGNTSEKMVALKAIDQINRISGAYNDGNNVTIAKNQDGEEIIQIKFQ